MRERRTRPASFPGFALVELPRFRDGPHLTRCVDHIDRAGAHGPSGPTFPCPVLKRRFDRPTHHVPHGLGRDYHGDGPVKADRFG